MSSDPSAATLDWDGARPVSARHGDAYYSDQDGLAEARHVFLDGVGLRELFQDRARLVVGETGFGTGLNILALWRCWRDAGRPVRLDVVSVEGYPLSAAEAARAHAPWPELAGLSEALRTVWPRPVPGLHRRVFDAGLFTLTIAHGEARHILAGLQASVDAWFLDGFAPARNPEMWSAVVFERLASLSAPGARLATFTTAGAVRRGLAAAGFDVEKRPGFGRKRDCLSGRLVRPPEPPARLDWDAPPRPMEGGEAVVLGAGIAGASAAASLDRRGWTVRVYDRHGAPAREASGNPAGVVTPALSLDRGPRGAFNAASFEHAASHLGALGADATGVLIPVGAGAEDRLSRIAVAMAHKGGLLSAPEASDRAGLSLQTPGLWLPAAGMVSPVELCTALLPAPVLRARVAGLDRRDGVWALIGGDGSVLDQAPLLVVAAGVEAATLLPDLPLAPKRGQVSLVAATKASAALRTILAGGPYLCPARDGVHLCGATFDRPDPDASLSAQPVRDADHLSNLRAVAGLAPDLLPVEAASVRGGRAGVRATTPDQLPIAGPVPDAQLFADAFAGLRGRGRRGDGLAAAPWRHGLYVLTGLGARGLTTAPLLGDWIADMATGAPWPLTRHEASAAHPARLLVRAIRRGRVT